MSSLYGPLVDRAGSEGVVILMDRGHKQSGVALLMVLFALALIGMGLPLLLEQGRGELERARLVHQRVQARSMVDAVEAMAVEALTDKRWRRSPLFWQALQGEWIDYSADGGEVRLRLHDLHGCFNINALAGEDVENARGQLLYLLSAGETRRGSLSATQLVDRATDWVDANARARPAGAESDGYLRMDPPTLSADTPMADITELNSLLPIDPARFLHYPELCAIAETQGWRLNLNALTLEQLPLLDALYRGRVSLDTLRRLILARPDTGYADASAVRALLSDMAADEVDTLLSRLILNGNYYRLEIEVVQDDRRYRFVRDLKALGVSQWAARVPAQRVERLAAVIYPL